MNQRQFTITGGCRVAHTDVGQFPLHGFAKLTVLAERKAMARGQFDVEAIGMEGQHPQPFPMVFLGAHP